ncbi:hypothetical protein P9K31_10585 [Corynebacterium glutamicum]|uniref:hypothetical protein n=1 Tax=Corynebacterium TaxID=1716 RepID=UPI0007219793|nr:MULTISPECIES: hypothetical protein [Corynebacterium]ALP49544.1 hypothetical protein AC079_04570 [Corynebacterium glutamicum]ANR61864.1 hypothetical protein C628_04390 [[Brevibacterium] flavum ZL-1]ANU33056.1 hypothetical protein BBD29_04365 [Corynebacterium glutamicum]APT06799.1 hypothetical protein BSP99_04480 [Corynebacterium glutamicum]PST76292.1 hypothetical protein I919_04452 [Corynebacterium glutamicum ZL-2]
MMLLLMNLPRFVEFMDKKLHIIETENIYVEAGQQKYAHLNVISAWDDGLIYQMVIRVDAGTVQRFVGYSSSADRNLREFGEASDDYAGLEDFLSQHIRRESMYGDFILRRLEESPDEIVWRYPEPNDETPSTLKELFTFKDKENIWFSSNFQPTN